ncbi:hypothetical protein [Lyngbya sp. PCC 8106]|uniref:hypothetical protein n=1 Tax=Lyngbya sp. (strain PCC 8106) TaxID=313612 RepID=UPI0000EAC76A|nr:hypothetical protein [Lyngbya sp. PCC 8106]EAW38657.1 hypothetical protein L8106_14620 [Lyngbya sp. PCC 8106]
MKGWKTFNNLYSLENWLFGLGAILTIRYFYNPKSIKILEIISLDRGENYDYSTNNIGALSVGIGFICGSLSVNFLKYIIYLENKENDIDIKTFFGRINNNTSEIKLEDNLKKESDALSYYMILVSRLVCFLASLICGSDFLYSCFQHLHTTNTSNTLPKILASLIILLIATVVLFLSAMYLPKILYEFKFFVQMNIETMKEILSYVFGGLFVLIVLVLLGMAGLWVINLVT